MNNDCFSARTVRPLAANANAAAVFHTWWPYIILAATLITHTYARTHAHILYHLYMVCWQKSWSTRTIKQERARRLAAASSSRENFKFLAHPGPCIISGIRYFDKLPDNLLNLPPQLSSPHDFLACTHTHAYTRGHTYSLVYILYMKYLLVWVRSRTYTYIRAADLRTCVCIGPDTCARKVHDGFWRAAKICGPSDLLCVPAPPCTTVCVYTHTHTLVRSYFTLRTHTHV